MGAPGNRQEFNRQVYEIVRNIPSGRVMTYGGIAERVQRPESTDPMAYRRIRARWVGYAMADAPQDLPWHRVVNARGTVSARMGFGPDIQRSLLEQEGIHFDTGGRLDLRALRWDPSDDRTPK